MKEYIYDIFLNKLDDIDNIIKLIDSLSKEDRKDFLVELMKKWEFTKEEFYSNFENKKIKLLCCLNEKGKLKFEYNDKIVIILDDIRNDLETGSILKKQLEKFLILNKNNKKLEIKKEEEEEKIIIQKLDLIKLILVNYDHHDLRGIILNINETIRELKFIKDSLNIFHRKLYEKDIKILTNIIKDIETKSIKEFKTQKMKEDIENLLKLQVICEEINKVNNFLFFKKIFEKSKGKDQGERFADARRQLSTIKELFQSQSLNIENIFKDIKEELSKKEESKSYEFIRQMENYFGIRNEETHNDLSIIIKSKKYEMVVKSIKFFFDNFSSKKLTLPKNIGLLEMNLKELILTLKKLKVDYIFNYESNSPFYKIFISLYEKKEAIDFLIEKIDSNINYLKDKLDPSIKSISIKDIEDTIECLNHFKNLINLNSLEIIEYIKDLDYEAIEKFVSYSKHYKSIIELDRKKWKRYFWGSI